MNLETITSVDRNAARVAFSEYRAAFQKSHDELDAELMRGYKALATGQQLIRLSETILRGGFDEVGRPKLAIARADETIITFERHASRLILYPTTTRTRVPDRRFNITTTAPVASSIWGGSWVARLPIVPPRLRPVPKMLNYHLLWEAEWYQPRAAVRAPRDPALLKRIGGDLFAVLAVWDLTDLERAVLEMRS